ncbi:hypothetical protein H072_2106 [Dactylellina haptotyla CBS 200.50]|uniref:Uncharacterized protein n=1 Tax=Dactylellina haptotyla (strain CBS 200.50) TaxID=1284197 RepID=S8ALW5_DACHA|nr:hypothetical protein H072_2106 [Dactylellina haptotyla CBS 200.50]
MAARTPLSTPGRGSVKHNPNVTPANGEAINSPRVPLTRARLSRNPTAETEWLSEQTSPQRVSSQKVVSPNHLADGLPAHKTFSTIKSAAHLIDPQKTARAALEFDVSEDNDSSGADTESQDENDQFDEIDPELLALSLKGRVLPNEGHYPYKGVATSRVLMNSAISSPTAGKADESMNGNALRPTKRKDLDNSPTQEPEAKKLRTSNTIAAELQAPLPPPRAFSYTKGHFQTVSTPNGTEIRHRVSLSNLRPSTPIQQPAQLSNPSLTGDLDHMAIPQNSHFIECLKKHNQHLEIQLFNRNFETNRQAEEIRRANAYAAQAKTCMRKDGDDVNRLRMLVLYARNKVGVWEKILEPLAILESASKHGENIIHGNSTMNTGSGVAFRVVQDARELIKNFEKAIRDVHIRPVHQIDEEVHTFATFNP